MLVKVDWISFSLLLEPYVCMDERDTEKAVVDALGGLNQWLFHWLDLGAGWVRTKGRAPYAISWTHPEGGITVMYHTKLPHALIEISGKGCDFLARNGHLESVLDAVKTRSTRVDIACDMLCDTRPTEFVEQSEAKRFKSHSLVVSESGETYYVGSRTSNRYVRVYRYNEPHERHMLLRSEFVVKAEDSKLAIQTILESGVRAVAFALGEKFGWKHPSWKPDESERIELEAYRPERREGKTLYWLSDTIAPLLVRLHEQGITDVRRWFLEQVETRLSPEYVESSITSN